MEKIKKLINKIGDLGRGGFFHVFIGNTLVKMIAFISSIVIVRLVEKTDYAYLTFADNLYNYVIAFAGLGMTSAILKFCATAKSKEEDKAYFFFSIKYGTLFQFLLSVLVIIYVSFFEIPFPAAKEITYVLVFYPALTNILTTILSYVRAHGNNKLYANMAVIQTGFVFICSLIFVYKLGINGIALARYIAIFIAIISSAKYISSMIKNVPRIKLSKEKKKSFFVMSISLMISSLFSLIMPMNEMTLINELLHDEVITANYKVAIMIPGNLSFVTQSIIIYYFTIIAKMDNKKEVWKLSKKITLGTSVIIGIICIAGVVLSPLIIRYVYGEKYVDAATLSIVFWVVYGINASIRMIPMNFLPAIGVAKLNAILAAFSCILHIVISYFAIKTWGIWGAGLATGIVYLLSAIVYWWYLRKYCLETKK